MTHHPAADVSQYRIDRERQKDAERVTADLDRLDELYELSNGSAQSHRYLARSEIVSRLPPLIAELRALRQSSAPSGGEREAALEACRALVEEMRHDVDKPETYRKWSAADTSLRRAGILPAPTAPDAGA